MYTHELSPIEQKIADNLPAEHAFSFVTEGVLETNADPRLPLTRRHLRHSLLQTNKNQIAREDRLEPLWKWFPFSKLSAWFDPTLKTLPPILKAKRIATLTFLVPLVSVFLFSQFIAFYRHGDFFHSFISSLFLGLWCAGPLGAVFFFPAVVKRLVNSLPPGTRPSPLGLSIMTPATLMQHTLLNAYLNQTLTIPQIQNEYVAYLPLPTHVLPGGFLHKMERVTANPENPDELVNALVEHLASSKTSFRLKSTLSSYATVDSKVEAFNEFSASKWGRVFLSHIEQTQLKEKHTQTLADDFAQEAL